MRYRQIRRLGDEMVVAFQFLTRIPMPSIAFEADSLSRATKFFPLVGLVVGSRRCTPAEAVAVPYRVVRLVAVIVLHLSRADHWLPA